MEISNSRCQVVLRPDFRSYKALSSSSDPDWKHLSEDQKVIKSCELLEQAVEKRIEQWLQNASVEQTHLVSHYIDQTEWREQVSMNVVALIFESLGIHFSKIVSLVVMFELIEQHTVYQWPVICTTKTARMVSSQQ